VHGSEQLDADSIASMSAPVYSQERENESVMIVRERVTMAALKELSLRLAIVMKTLTKERSDSFSISCR